ncbi:MAG: polymer-forming cytoskeletal protein [Pseudomonadota bacterium]
MFSKKKQPPIKSLIADGTEVQGNLRFADGLRIDGNVTGDILAAEGRGSLLVVSETATVTGSVRADHVIINGRVKGPVFAAELLELQPKARIDGDVTYKALEMHQGAVIFGLLKATDAAVQAEEAPLLKLAASKT